MIDKSKKYKFLYVSVSFKNNHNFVKFLKDHLGIEVPYMDQEDLRVDVKDSLDSYVYIEDSPKFKETYRFLNKKFPKVSFTVLGTVRGNEIFNFFGKCNKEVKGDLIPGEQYRISEGEYKNLIVRVASQKGEIVRVYFKYLATERYLEIPVSHLMRLESKIDTYVFQDFREKSVADGLKRALVIDAFDVIRRSLVYHRDKYSSTGKYVGGVFGVYFNLLKLKELFPEYQIFWCVDGCGPQRFLDSLQGYNSTPALGAYYLDTQEWGKAFCKGSGFYVFEKTGIKVEHVLASAVESAKSMGYNDILVYSGNNQFHTLLDKNLTILNPKDSHRGNSQFLKKEDVLTLWGVSSPEKLKWLKSVIGDNELPEVVPAIGYVGPSGNRATGIKNVDYMNAIHQAQTLEEFKQILQGSEKFREFVGNQMDQNLRALTLDKSLLTKADAVLEDFNEDALLKLLSSHSLYKEIEMLDRNFRILKSLW